EDSVKTTRPAEKRRRRPKRSASDPAVSTVEASASVYASTTHCRPLSPLSRSSAIRESAVFTTAISSISIAVAAHTTTRVQRFGVMRRFLPARSRWRDLRGRTPGRPGRYPHRAARGASRSGCERTEAPPSSVREQPGLRRAHDERRAEDRQAADDDAGPPPVLPREPGQIAAQR